MTQTITVVFKRGVLRPRGKVPFREGQQLTLTVEGKRSLTEATRGIIRVSPRVARRLAEGDEFALWGR